MNSIMLQPTALPAVMEYASQLVASGFLPKAIDTPQKAVAIITLGYELGLTPWAAINGVNVIAGKPTISPALMLGLINRSGFLENMTIDADDTRAIVTMKRFGRDAHTETFTIEDAARMKTTEWVNNTKRSIPLSEKDNWKQQPRVMLKWRAVSACARVVFPDVLAGLYTTEEISPDNTTVSEDGEVTYEPPPMLEAGEPTMTREMFVTELGKRNIKGNDEQIKAVLEDYGLLKYKGDYPRMLAELDKVLNHVAKVRQQRATGQDTVDSYGDPEWEAEDAARNGAAD